MASLWLCVVYTHTPQPSLCMPCCASVYIINLVCIGSRRGIYTDVGVGGLGTMIQRSCVPGESGGTAYDCDQIPKDKLYKLCVLLKMDNALARILYVLFSCVQHHQIKEISQIKINKSTLCIQN